MLSDYDECATITDNNCEQLCTNTPGAFVCSCNPGYLASNNTCLGQSISAPCWLDQDSWVVVWVRIGLHRS